MNFGAIQPMASTATGIVFVLLGALAVYAMLKGTGGRDPASAPAWLRVHRVAGWGFALLFLGMFVYMTIRVTTYTDEFSARAILHITLAAALLCVLALKVSIPRLFPALQARLFFLGSIAFVLGFSLVFITAGYHVVKVLEGRAYVWHSAWDAAFLDERLGKEFLISKCSTCHALEKILRPRSAAAWQASVSRMVDLARPRISEAEAEQILGYLVKNQVPKVRAAAPGASLLEKHCFPCHEPRDILVTHHTLEDWKVVIRAMNGYDADLVPFGEVDAIAEYLVEMQAREERRPAR